MSAYPIMFYLISAFILVTGLLAVTTRKIFRSAIWLLFSLIGIAALYFWMQVEFIAAVQIIVYVGGIVVLIIFSIFLTQKSGTEMQKPPMGRSIAAAVVVIVGLALTGSLLFQNAFVPNNSQPLQLTVAAIGGQMLSTTDHGYILPFELVSILLLAAMIGAIVIAIKVKPVDEEKKLNQ